MIKKLGSWIVSNRISGAEEKDKYSKDKEMISHNDLYTVIREAIPALIDKINELIDKVNKGGLPNRESINNQGTR